jgi:undecaprenyl phosphate-alpha-L-ara4FN deformylase
MRIGLRIDVDTFRGTRLGVPNLCRLLASHSIQATFYFSVGPDNMGRHLWRLFKPSFLGKMLRSKAPNLYGWDILLRGTFGSGPIIGEKLGDIIKKTSQDGHEIGFHGWDHHAWQAHIDTMNSDGIYHSIKQGVDMLTKITDKPPVSSAVPGWKCNDLVLIEKNKFPFKYNSDCRGRDIFFPVVNGKTFNQPQIPVTLPTYDEIIGRKGISDDNYNEYILSLIKSDVLNVLTIHAEVEGIAKFQLFSDFIRTLDKKGGTFITLGTLLSEGKISKYAELLNERTTGREGWVTIQGQETECR